tara:strand:+ start:3385 stop:3768 length:384 start_codon:yes stop_codon:yes gene_type:complete
MEILIQGLREDDPMENLKVIGWGNIAQQMQSDLKMNDLIILEGRLRMSIVPREDGTKEKIAELTTSKIHNIQNGLKKKTEPSEANSIPSENNLEKKDNQGNSSNKIDDIKNEWDSSPLVPEIDEIPF